jgi:Flp pilus assembly pilin Flp
MKRVISWFRANDDEGMATVEYALVTVAAAAFAAVLIAIVKSPEVRSALASLVSQALGGS